MVLCMNSSATTRWMRVISLNLAPQRPSAGTNLAARSAGLVKKDKAFFFFNYEGLRQHLDQTFTALVPTVAARATAVPAVQSLVNLYSLPTTDLGNGIGSLITV